MCFVTGEQQKVVTLPFVVTIKSYCTTFCCNNQVVLLIEAQSNNIKHQSINPFVGGGGRGGGGTLSRRRRWPLAADRLVLRDDTLRVTASIRTRQAGTRVLIRHRFETIPA